MTEQDGGRRRVPSGDRAAGKRRAIVRAARDCFVRDGFGVGVDQIAAEAGASKVTVYNHFGSKENLFLEVIHDALEEGLAEAVAGTAARLTASSDLQEALIWTARAWVRGMTKPDVVALRRLVAAEVRQFPELGQAWQLNGPSRTYPALADFFGRLVETGELVMPDIDLAVVQLYSLVLYPHLIYSAYGSSFSPERTEDLIRSGVAMFLSYYRYRPPAS